MSGIGATGSAGTGATGTPATATEAQRAKLRALSHQFEGVFLDQLFKAMRQTVPQGGFLAKSPGEEMFTSMLDERVADVAAQRMERGLGEALYRQLSRRLEAAAGPRTENGR